MPKEKRSLYCCLNAKVLLEIIYCSKGHKLHNMGGDVSIKRLIRGCALEFAVCQDCPDYSELGPPVAKKDRGWE